MYFVLLAILTLGGSSLFWYFYSLEKNNVVKTIYLICAILTIFIAFVIIFIYLYHKKLKEIKKLKTQIEVWADTTYHINAAGDMAFQTLPIGIMIYDKDFNIVKCAAEEWEVLEGGLFSAAHPAVPGGQVHVGTDFHKLPEHRSLLSRVRLLLPLYRSRGGKRDRKEHFF